MKRKRFIKIAMSQGLSKNQARVAAMFSIINHGGYKKAFDSFGGLINGRFEMYCNIQGHAINLNRLL